MKNFTLKILSTILILLTSNCIWGQQGIALTPPTGSNTELAAGKYYLSQDMTPGSNKRWKIDENREITIDLYGHTINAKNIELAVFNIADGKLTIIDTSPEKTGKIINSTKSCIFLQRSSSRARAIVDFQGGTIYNCHPSDGNGGAFDIRNGTVVNMSGNAKIESCNGKQGAAVYVTGGTFNMEGGSIVNNRVDATKNWTPPGENAFPGYLTTANSDKGGGVYVEAGTFNMSGGTIEGNVSNLGGGVYITSGAKFNLTGGTIKNNYSTSKAGSNYGNGGGIYINAGSTCTVEGNASNPITISGNKATRYGGGIYADGADVDIKYCNFLNNYASSGGGVVLEKTTSEPCNMDLYNCTIEGNISIPQSNYLTNPGGGGIFMTNGTLSIKETTSITSNTTSSANTTDCKGGGIYIASGSIIVDSGKQLTVNSNNANSGGGIYCAGNITISGSSSITENESTNGGGIYCTGAFTVNNTGSIEVESNTATNGGGICMENGTVILSSPSCEINSNIASNNGGGLYVLNNSNTRKKSVFSGGNFSDNEASAGGAICANGLIDLILGAVIKNNIPVIDNSRVILEENQAINGGGIYMSNGVDLTFGDGIIRMNTAQNKNSIDNQTTAYQCTSENIEGVGGGIFMAGTSGKPSSIVFLNAERFGIYNNEARFAANDIFCNGNNTKITLPDIEEMNLTDFDVPGNMLYWVEDYANYDTKYSEGTAIIANGNGVRYEEMLKNNDPTAILGLIPESMIGVELQDYICLDLGYDLVFLTIKNIGLKLNDDATYDLYSKNNFGVYELYCKILFTGTGSDLSRVISLPSGTWKIVSVRLNYKYNATPTYNPESVGTDNGFVVKRGQENVITITNSLDPSISNINEFNSRKVNRMKRNSN